VLPVALAGQCLLLAVYAELASEERVFTTTRPTSAITTVMPANTTALPAVPAA
jgi:hypothetical protein